MPIIQLWDNIKHMSKQIIKPVNIISILVKKARGEEKRIGLITGCFDILHMDHINLFRFAKKRVDVLIVGVENDASIKISKGIHRPLNKLEERMKFLSELSLIDYIFPITNVYSFNSNEAAKVHKDLLKKINPGYLITRTVADKYWKNKKKIAEELGIIFLPDKGRKMSSSSRIIEKLEKQI
jgi:cytidyltransferase-like protein